VRLRPVYVIGMLVSHEWYLVLIVLGKATSISSSMPPLP
jgi:hypothetical protein